MPLNLLSGDDVFISYSRRDGALYAAGLADKLTEKGLSCFIDKLGTEPNHDLPDSLRKKIRNCTVFVLVGTEKAAHSKFVAKEIGEFKQTGRTILPVDFQESVGNAEWYSLIPGIATEPERNPKALDTGDPSPNVLSFIEKSFKYTRRNQRMFRMFLFVLGVFLTLTAVSVGAGFVARNQLAIATAATKLATDKAAEAQRASELADQKTTEAQAASELADRKTGEAERATKLAEEKTKEADAATRLAREKTHAAEVAQAATVAAEGRRRIAEKRAREQENVANSREGAATALSLLEFDPEASLKQASKAYESAHTTQAADALRKSLFESHIQSVLRGHDGIIWDATFDREGRLAVTASRDGTVRVWDARTGSEMAKLSGGGGGDLLQVRVSDDGRYVAAAAAEQQSTMLLWKLTDKSLADKPRVLRGVVNQSGPAAQCSSKCSIRTVAFSPDGRQVAAAGDAGVVWVWETETGKAGDQLYDHKNAINQLTFSPDGSRILSAGADDQALLWEWQAPRGPDNPRALPHGGPVVSASFSRDGRHILTAWNKAIQGGSFIRTEGGEAWVWETDTRTPPVKLAGHIGALVGAEFSPDGEFVVTASDDTTARVWRWNSEVKDFPMILRGHTAGLHSAEFSPDGEYVVTSSIDGTARVWKPGTNRYIAEQTKKSVDVPALAVLRGHSGDLWRATYSADGRYILTASEDQTARVWKARVENVVATLPAHRLMVQGAALSPDGRHLATTTAGYQPVRVWDWRDVGRREPIAVLRLPQGARFRDPIFSPEGKFVAAVLDNVDGGAKELENKVAVWEWEREESRLSPTLLGGPLNHINSIAFSHDDGGRYIVTASGASGFNRDGVPLPSDDTVRVYDRSSEDGLRNPVELKGHTSDVGGAVFSPDDRYVVSASNDGVRVWEWRTEAGRRDPVVLNGVTPYGFSHVAVSPDGEYIAAAGGGPNVTTVWRWRDKQTRKNPVVLRGHTDIISSVAFSPNGALVLTSSQDGTERLWDARTGLLISILSGHERASQTASFSGDGRLLVVTNQLTALVYSCEMCTAPDDLMALVPEHISSNNLAPAAGKNIP